MLKIKKWLLLLIVMLTTASPVFASFHLWRLNEIYSNASGSIQFIELTSAAGGQEFLTGHSITTTQNGVTRSYTFPSDLPGDTTNKTFLIATQGFAALNLVTPDYVVPDGFLFATDATLDFARVDSISYASLPADPTQSLGRNGSTGVNSPRNFSGATATVIVAAPPAVTGFSVNLLPGWNLLGNSVNVVLNVGNTFGNASNVAAVWKWNPISSKWAFYTPTQSDSGAAFAAGNGYEFLSSVGAGEGFWVSANTSSTVQLPTGSAVASASFSSLPMGWSLLSVGDNPGPSGFNNALSSTPPSPGTTPASVASVWAWDAANQNWYFYAPSLEAQGGTVLTDYISSHGFRDFTISGKTLGQGSGFWVNRP